MVILTAFEKMLKLGNCLFHEIDLCTSYQQWFLLYNQALFKSSYTQNWRIKLNSTQWRK